MHPDPLIQTKRTASIEPLPRPAASSQKAFIKCMQCGETWACERDREAGELGHAHTVETGHTRLLIIRSVHEAA